MAKYSVIFYIGKEYEVEADDQEDAIRAARDLMGNQAPVEEWESEEPSIAEMG